MKKLPIPPHVHRLSQFQNDLTGTRFGRLMVVAYRGKAPKTKNSMWLCLCDCGRTRDMVRYQDLMQGRTNNCPACKAENQVAYHRKRSRLLKRLKKQKEEDFA